MIKIILTCFSLPLLNLKLCMWLDYEYICIGQYWLKQSTECGEGKNCWVTERSQWSLLFLKA